MMGRLRWQASFFAFAAFVTTSAKSSSRAVKRQADSDLPNGNFDMMHRTVCGRRAYNPRKPGRMNHDARR